MVSGRPVEAGARAARARALAVLRIRGRALAVALLPAGAAVIVQAGVATGQFAGPAWAAVRWVVMAFAVLVLAAAAFFGLVVARSRPAVSPTVTIPEASAPDLYRLVRDLADRLEVPAPSAIALTPDCDSWLEDRTHPAHDDQHAPTAPTDASAPPDSGGPDPRGPGSRGPGSRGPDGPDSHARADAAERAQAQQDGQGSGRRVDIGLRVDPGARVDERAEGRAPAEGRRGVEAAGPGADALPVLGRPGGGSGPGHAGVAGEGAAQGAGAAGSRAAHGTGRRNRTGRRDRTGRPAGAGRAKRPQAAPVLVIGSPFLWWMRVAELRALLAPVVAGTGPSAHPDIAAARRFVRGLDAAVAVAAAPGRGPLPAVALRCAGWVARKLLAMCREPAAEMERCVAAAAAERAQAVDYGLRIVAQEQVGLAYAGWDRLLTRVALPAWRMGRWPSRLDAGVVAALTELSRRDRLAEGFASRLGERPACDLLEEPGAIDEATSLLAARLFHGGPAEPGRDWVPVDWQQYPAEVVDRKWRADAARLQRVLDLLGVRRPAGAAQAGGADPPEASLVRVMDHLSVSEPLSGLPGRLPERLPQRRSQRRRGPMPEPAHGTGGTDALGTSGTANDPALAESSDASGAPRRLGEADRPDHRHAHESPNAPGARSTPAAPTAPTSPTAPATPSRHRVSREGEGGDASAHNGPAHGASAHGAPSHDGPAHGGAVSEGPAPDGSQAGPPSLTGHISHTGSDTGGDTSSAAGSAARTTPDTDSDPRTDRDPHTDTEPGTGRDTDRPAPPHDPARPYANDPAPRTFRTRGAAHKSRGAALAAELSAELAREEAAHREEHPGIPGPSDQRHPDGAPWDEGLLPLFPMQPPRTARELLADHITAVVCCAAVDTVGAAPGLDWLDGPALLVGGVRAADLAPRVLSLVEDGDPEPLRGWLTRIGVHPEKPVRLV